MEFNFRDVLFIIVLTILLSIPAIENTSFAADDYRYLSQIQKLDLQSLTTIKNTWSQLWWHPPENEITFFRPTVILSYLADYSLWGVDPRGFMMSSILIHVLCSILAYVLFMQLLDSRKLALVAGLLFAIHPIHGEALWYIAGRTDSLAALFWLLAFLFYVKKSDNKLFYGLSLVSFSLALLTKESSLMLLPVLFVYEVLFSEYNRGRVRRVLEESWRLYGGFLVVFVLYFVLRFYVTGQLFFNQTVYPYFFTPGVEGFPLHVGVMALLYLFNLTFGLHTVPFYTSDGLFMDGLFSTYLLPLVLTVLFILAVLVFLRGDRVMLFLAGLSLLTFLPVTVMYTSERFMYLPSFGFIGILVLVLAELGSINIPGGKYIFNALMVLLLLHYSVSFLSENSEYASHKCPEFITSRFTHALDGKLAEGAHRIFILNYFDGYVCSVFLEDIVRVHYSNNDITVRILTANADRDILPTIEKTGPNTIQVTSNPLFKSNFLGFQSRPLRVGEVIEMDYFTVTVLEASGEGVSKMRFTFKQPVESGTFLLLDGEVTKFTEIL